MFLIFRVFNNLINIKKANNTEMKLIYFFAVTTNISLEGLSQQGFYKTQRYGSTALPHCVKIKESVIKCRIGFMMGYINSASKQL